MRRCASRISCARASRLSTYNSVPEPDSFCVFFVLFFRIEVACLGSPGFVVKSEGNVERSRAARQEVAYFQLCFAKPARLHFARTARALRDVCERGVLTEFRAARTCASYWFDKTLFYFYFRIRVVKPACSMTRMCALPCAHGHGTWPAARSIEHLRCHAPLRERSERADNKLDKCARLEIRTGRLRKGAHSASEMQRSLAGLTTSKTAFRSHCARPYEGDLSKILAARTCASYSDQSPGSSRAATRGA